METKPVWQSKVFWVNILGIVWILFAEKAGLPTLDPGMEATLLGLINVVLRLITKQPVTIS